MEILTSTSVALVGAAAGYGVLVLASKTQGVLRPAGYAVGTLVVAGSVLTAGVCVSKCSSMYERKCPMSDSVKGVPENVSGAVKAAAG